MAANQKLTREAIGKILHKHNKKRFAWPAIGKDEGMNFEALKDDVSKQEQRQATEHILKGDPL